MIKVFSNKGYVLYNTIYASYFILVLTPPNVYKTNLAIL